VAFLQFLRSVELASADLTALRKSLNTPRWSLIAAPNVGHRWNQTVTSDFGHFCAEVPKSLHIGAYPRVFADRSRLPRRYKTPASSRIRCPLVSEMGLIAMQKVEGSNPFSRLRKTPSSAGFSAFWVRPAIGSVRLRSAQYVAQRPMD
jgi:hypothetical protein